MPRRPRNPSHREISDSDSDSDFVVDDLASDADYSAEELVVVDSDDEDDDVVAQVVHEAPVPRPPPPPPPRTRGSKKRRRKEKRRGGGGGGGDSPPPLAWQLWAESNNKWVDDFATQSCDLPTSVAAPAPPVADPAPEILLPLLRFQKEWLAWALKQEDSESRGGILADEMGMGKTIQAISLVLTARRVCPPSLQPSVQPPRVNCTLVICPVVAVIQWAGEIERHTAKGSTRVLVYHGAKRTTAKYNFAEYDFVLTTYSMIEADYRKYVMPPKVRCQYCDKMFYPNKMRIHLKYYCGPDAQRTEKQARQVSKKKWGATAKGKKKKKDTFSEEEEEEMGKKGKKGKKGGGSKKKAGDFSGMDGDDCTAGSSSSSHGKSLLHSVKWQRIILDEAHFIKDRRCNTARAVFALESEYKWALSGTPLQNRVGELYSLIRFLQIFPYSYYFCKDCDCKILDTRMSKHCVDCSHSSVRHFCWWNKYISKPIQQGSGREEGRKAMVLLKERLLKGIVLRRTKKGRAADLALPPKIVTLRRDSLDKNEQEFYEALYTQSRTQFDSYVDAGTLMNNYAHIFDLLTRLRQAVDHPYLVIYSKTSELPKGCKNEEHEAIKSDCGLCHLPAEDMVVTSCDHLFCKACLIDYSASLGNVSCPSCSKPLTVDLATKNSGEKVYAMTSKGVKRSGILSRLKSLADFKTSTKIDALREEVRNMVGSDGSAKGIVFSQFTSFLDLINFSLQRSGIKCVQLVGSMSLSEREKAIAAFADDPDCKIFLMSLKAGGVALNLTVASHVFLMDPWWNPAVENQAQDRIHRIGQYKPIRSIRFVIEDTIEERILKLQEKKELVFEGTVGDSAEAMSKLTEADLRFLFQI